MLKGITKNGVLKNVVISEDGELLIKEMGEIQDVETTLNASIKTVGVEATSVMINKKVTTIDVANYGSGDVTITIGDLEATIGSNIATSLKINRDVESISFVSTQNDTKIQFIIEGVE